jgi:hypothetical protein
LPEASWLDGKRVIDPSVVAEIVAATANPGRMLFELAADPQTQVRDAVKELRAAHDADDRASAPPSQRRRRPATT